MPAQAAFHTKRCKPKHPVSSYRDSGPQQLQLVLAYISQCHHVAPKYVLGPSRGSRYLSMARQIMFFLLHVCFGMSYTHIGRLSLRDRTSVAHGVSRVEDYRDDEKMNRALHYAELSLTSIFEASWNAADDTCR